MTRFQRFVIYAGHFIENFDNMLYGFLSVMLVPIFFPTTSSESINQLLSFTAFFVGFLSKPLGAVFWGNIGDSLGRKIPLVYSMGLMGIPTLAIGLLPSYDSIGVASTVVLFICRALQGFMIGGEYAGATVYMIESSGKNTLKNLSELVGFGVSGALVAVIIGSVVTSDIFPAWGWRVPFIFGGLFAIGVFVLRRNIRETKEFIEASNEVTMEIAEESPNDDVTMPEINLFTIENLDKIIASCLIFSVSSVSLYLATIYGNVFFKKLDISNSYSLMIAGYSLLLANITVIMVGRVVQNIAISNFKIVMFGIVLTIISGFIAFSIISMDNVSIVGVLFYAGLLSASGAVMVVPSLSYISEIYTVKERYTAMAIVSTLGPSIISGATPLAASYLHKISGGDNFMPFFWLLIVYVIAMLSLLYIEFFYKNLNRGFDF